MAANDTESLHHGLHLFGSPGCRSMCTQIVLHRSAGPEASGRAPAIAKLDRCLPCFIP